MAKKKGKKSYGFGLVGCGMIAEFHAQAVEAMQGGHLVCVHDMYEKSAKALGRKYKVAWYTDLKEFLAHDDLDIVSVCTPSGAHVEPCVAAAKAKKHIICEKPLDVTLERCDKIIRTYKDNRVKLAGIFPSRFTAALKRIKDEIASGRLGRITIGDANIKWFRSQEYYDSGAWRGTWELDGGGACMNQSIHTIDLLQWLMGPVKEITAYAGLLAHKRIQVEDVATAIVKYKNGALGTIVASSAAFPGNPREVQVSGENGSIFLEDNFIIKWDFNNKKSYDAGVKKKFGKDAGGRTAAGAADPSAIDFAPHQHQFQNFVNALNGKEKILVDGPEARKAVEIILAMYKSALTGKPVKLPLKRTPKLGKFPK